MLRRVLTTAVALGVCLVLFSGSVAGRDALSSGRGFDRPMASRSPDYCMALHNVGKLVLAVVNNGTFGSNFAVGESVDCFTGDPVPAGGCEYPKGSGVQYMFSAGFWVGAVVGRDTLVSTGTDGWVGTNEFFPADAPFGTAKKRSIIDPAAPEFEGAVSEQDYIFTYEDTSITLAGQDPEDNARRHIPLYIQVTQRSYAWSYDYAEDLILFDFEIKNIGRQRLRNVYMGIYVDADVCDDCDQGEGFADDICGFRATEERPYRAKYGDCLYEDTVYIAWISDNDGDFDGGSEVKPTPHVTGTRIVRTPADSLDVSFNWWISNGTPSLDFGPREKDSVGEWKEPFRDFGSGGLGTPTGDRNRYYVLRNREFDYDQIFTATILQSDPLWLKPELPQTMLEDFADGYDTRYLLSFGPFNINVGQKLPLSFSYLAGENFHTSETNGDNLPGLPNTYYQNLNFADLGLNSTWASWIYDNPGVDSDGNGYRGKFRIQSKDPATGDVRCWPADSVDFVPEEFLQDTIWYEGDGIPDFRGASPPPAPSVGGNFWLEPEVGRIRVRFNGLNSETNKDVFSGLEDFEGYRIYYARDNRATSYTMLASYDRQDFNKFVYDPDLGWKLYDPPYTLEELRDLFQDPDLDPEAWPRQRPYQPTYNPTPEFTQYYFAAQDYNVSDLSDPAGIHKVYPDQPYPSTLIAADADPSELTPEGRFKYFEYEYIIEDMLPSVPYYVNVTAFDYGSPVSGLASLETSKTVGALVAYPLSTAEDVEKENLEVIVYPNPYRVDADYRDVGFEGRGPDDINRPDSRVRELHFANLPAKCTIRIYTIDGDLVREINHNMNPADPNASHNSWDLITRNTQMVVSGLYYWTVEDDEGNTQMGKVAIIM